MIFEPRARGGILGSGCIGTGGRLPDGRAWVMERREIKPIWDFSTSFFGSSLGTVLGSVQFNEKINEILASG